MWSLSSALRAWNVLYGCCHHHYAKKEGDRIDAAVEADDFRVPVLSKKTEASDRVHLTSVKQKMSQMSDHFDKTEKRGSLPGLLGAPGPCETFPAP